MWTRQADLRLELKVWEEQAWRGPCWAAVSRAQVGQAGLPPGGCPGTACWDAGGGRCRWAAQAAVWLHVEVQAGQHVGLGVAGTSARGDIRLWPPSGRSLAAFAGRPVSEVAPPGLVSGAASWRGPLT